MDVHPNPKAPRKHTIFAEMLSKNHKKKPLFITTVSFILLLSFLDQIWKAPESNQQVTSAVELFMHSNLNQVTINTTHIKTNKTRTTKKFKNFIRGAILQGNAVQKFRNHLDCFSESGKWVYNSTARHIPWNYAGDQYASQCDGKHSIVKGNAAGGWAEILASHPEYGNWTVREELKWVWRTNNSCPIIPIDRIAFCKLIGAYGGNVMVVGDSINHLVQFSLLNNLLKSHDDPEVVELSSHSRVLEGFQVCGDVLGNDEAFKVGFVRNDRLSIITDGVQRNDGYKNFLEWPWIHLIPKWNVKLLLLNKGAHFEDDTTFASFLKQTLKTLKNLYPDLPVFYRNTPPGHENCTSYKGPIAERQRIVDDKYHWSEFRRQNSIAREIVERNGYVYVDVDGMLSRRPDGHINEKDCLHYCIPGPLDSFVELLFNVLNLLQQYSYSS